MLFFMLSIGISFPTRSSAQSFLINPAFSKTDYRHFKNLSGYEISYFHLVNKRAQIGISFSQSFFQKPFSYLYWSLNDGHAYDRTVQPKNMVNTLSLAFEVDLFRKKNTSLFLGPMISLNNLERKETIIDILKEKNTIYAYTLQETKNNKMGVGLKFAFHQKLYKHLWIFGKVDPSVIFYRKPNLLGTSDPSMISVTNYGLGINYNIKK